MKTRPTILGLMGIVAFLAVGMASLRTNDELRAAVIFVLPVAALCTATLVAMYRRGAWAGFAVFGWAAFLISQPQAPPAAGPTSLPMGLVYQLLVIGRIPAVLPPAVLEVPAFTVIAEDVSGQPMLAFVSNVSTRPLGYVPIPTMRAASCLLSLVIGLVGAIVGGLIDRRSVAGRDGSEARDRLHQEVGEVRL